MPLSDEEIKYLLEKAEAYEKTSGLPELEQALKCYNKVIDNTTPHPHYYFKRATVKYSLVFTSTFHDLDGAIEDMDRAIELEPDKGEYYRLRGEYLMLKLTEERYVSSDDDRKHLLERIVEDYRASKERNPTDPQLWLDLIEVSILSHDYDKAIGLYGDSKQFMETNEDKVVRSWLGCLALALAGDPIDKDDKESLEQRLGWEEIDAKTLLLRYVKMSTFVAVLHKGEIDRGASRNVRKVQWLFSNWFYHTGSKRRATYPDDYNELIELRPVNDMELNYSKLMGDESYKVHKLASYPLWDDGNAYVEPAIKHDDGFNKVFEKYEKILQLNPKDYDAQYAKGVLLNYLERYEEAIEEYESAKMHANTALASTAWHNQGVILDKLERHEEALEAFSRATVLSAGDAFVAAVSWYNRGRMYERLKRYEEAIDAYDKAIALDQNFIQAWYEKSTILKHLNRYDEAIYAQDRSVDSRPYHSIFSSFFERACRDKVNLCERLNRYEESLETLYKVLPLVGGITLRLREGFLLERFQQYEEALDAYDQAINASGKDKDDIARAWYRKACIHSARGNKADVLKDLSNAIEINADYKDKAQKDEPFKNFWDDEDFKRIVG